MAVFPRANGELKVYKQIIRAAITETDLQRQFGIRFIKTDKMK